MKKSLLSLSLLFFCLFGFSQKDSTKHLFAPGTLVGQYYGTYDTTTKRDNLADSTRLISEIGVAPIKNEQKLNNNQLSTIGSIQSNVKPDPIDYSGTTQATGIESQSQTGTANLTTSGIPAEAPPRLKSTIDPFETSGTGFSSQIDINNQQENRVTGAGSVTGSKELRKNPDIHTSETPKVIPQISYQLTRLGSSTEIYGTYSKNKNGTGGITTSTNKSTNIPTGSVNTPGFTPPASVIAREKLNLLSGSSEPYDATYQSNDDAAGLITTSTNKADPENTIHQNISANQGKKDAREVLGLRFGSSTPSTATFADNNNGLGWVTTSSKAGGNTSSGTAPLSKQPSSLNAREKLNLEQGSSEPYDSTYNANDDDAGLITTSANKGVSEKNNIQNPSPDQEANEQDKK